MTTLLPRIEINSADHPTAAVIWLHGLGADGNDFASLVPELDLQGCAGIRFVFPHAPRIAVTVNSGFVMPAWYDIAGTDLAQRQDRAGIENSQRAVQALIAAEVARGIPASRIVLAGFSQGCAVALHTALRQSEPLAGVIALSGYLPLAEHAAGEHHAASTATPVFMAHGTQDPVVLVPHGEASRDVLLALGYRVEWHSYPMQHSVHPQEIADISGFLQRVLPATR